MERHEVLSPFPCALPCASLPLAVPELCPFYSKQVIVSKALS